MPNKFVFFFSAILTCWSDSSDCFQSSCAGLKLLEQNNNARLEHMTPDTKAVRDKHAFFSVVQLDVAKHGACSLFPTEYGEMKDTFRAPAGKPPNSCTTAISQQGELRIREVTVPRTPQNVSVQLGRKEKIPRANWHTSSSWTVCRRALPEDCATVEQRNLSSSRDVLSRALPSRSWCDLNASVSLRLPSGPCSPARRRRRRSALAGTRLRPNPRLP